MYLLVLFLEKSLHLKTAKITLWLYLVQLNSWLRCFSPTQMSGGKIKVLVGWEKILYCVGCNLAPTKSASSNPQGGDKQKHPHKLPKYLLGGWHSSLFRRNDLIMMFIFYPLDFCSQKQSRDELSEHMSFQLGGLMLRLENEV